MSAALLLSLAACGGNQTSFSIMGEENNFSQSPTIEYGKVDVLWVVDNSGSMKSSQEDLINSMNDFTHDFWTKGVDFRMAVITTEAYRSLFGAAATITEFRNGNATDGASGYPIIDPATPNGDQMLIKNINQGVGGNGDERAFQSIKQALEHNINLPYGFPRADAALSIVILSDEDDYSHNNSNHIGGVAGDMTVYDNPALHPIQMYVDYLDQKTGSTPAKRNYAVHSITIMDETCRAQRNAVNGGQRIGIRYLQLTAAVGGETGSLCDPFGDTLQRIAKKSINLTAKFKLNREPNPDTIRVWVDGKEIFNDATNGWTYVANGNYLEFHGDSIPDPGQSIAVRFDPTSIK